MYITFKVSFKGTQGPKIQHQKVHVFPRQTDGNLKCDTFDAIFSEYCALLKKYLYCMYNLIFNSNINNYVSLFTEQSGFRNYSFNIKYSDTNTIYYLENKMGILIKPLQIIFYF